MRCRCYWWVEPFSRGEPAHISLYKPSLYLGGGFQYAHALHVRGVLTQAAGQGQRQSGRAKQEERKSSAPRPVLHAALTRMTSQVQISQCFHVPRKRFCFFQKECFLPASISGQYFTSIFSISRFPHVNWKLPGLILSQRGPDQTQILS